MESNLQAFSKKFKFSQHNLTFLLDLKGGKNRTLLNKRRVGPCDVFPQ